MNFRDAIIPTAQQLERLYKTSASTSTMQPRIPPQPTPRDVPRNWAMNYLPPGIPLSPLVPMGVNYPTYRSDPSREPRTSSRIIDVTPLGSTDNEGRSTSFQIRTEDGAYDFQFTPRSYQYPPNVNTTITPRISYGLMSFADIENLSISTPDVMLCSRLLKREFMGLVPKVAHDDGEGCDDEGLNHFVKYPDGFNPLSIWLGRWFFNGVIFDAPALHMPRAKDGSISALVNIDGSSIFLIIDENGNPPKPPAPAFLQIIWGTPYGFASTEQLWYRPNDLQIKSNYGTALVESANLPAQLLNNIWKYETAWFTAGTLPEYVVTAPQGWTNDQVAAWLIDKTNALAGHPELRAQFDVWPFGFQSLVVKSVEFRREVYQIAKREVMEHAGLPVSEIGETQHGGLGGKGFMDAMGQAIFRQAFLPWMKATSEPFNDVFAINNKTCIHGETFHELLWDFLPQSIDPDKEQKKITEQWTNGQITLGQATEAIGLDPPTDERLANARLLPKGSVLIDEHGEVIASVKDNEDVPEELQPEPKVYPSAAGAPAEKPGAVAAEGDEAERKPGDEQRKLLKDVKDTGVMVALPIPPAIGARLLAAAKAKLPMGAELEPLDNLHITLAYLGDLAEKEMAVSKDATGEILRLFTKNHAPLHGKIGGIARFMPGDEGKTPLVALFDCPELPGFRQELVEALKAGGVGIDETHGFTPHITLAYCPEGSGDLSVDLEPEEITFTDMIFAWGGKWDSMPLGKAAIFEDLRKHCGACEEDDAYYGAPISREVSMLAPIQGANETEIVAVSPDGLPSRPFAWKAEGNENPKLVEQIGHPQYLAEEACYLGDRALQFYLVPVSFVATVDGERGAAIHWVLNSGQLQHAYDYAPEWIEKAAVEDYIFGQTDRGHDPHKKNVNYLTHPDDPKRMILLDNGLSFPTSDSERRIASDFVDVWGAKPLSAAVMDVLPVFKDNAEVWRRITDLVGSDAVEQAQKRLDAILEAGNIPK